MTASDDLKRELDEVISTANQAAYYGSLSVTKATDAITALQNARDEMIESRNRAMQSLEQLLILVSQTDSVTMSSMSVDMISAGLDFVNSKIAMEQYGNRMAFAIDKIDKIISVISQLRIDAELIESGKALKKGVDSTVKYRNYL